MIAKQKYENYYKSISGYKNSNIEDDKNHGVPIMSRVFYIAFLNLKRIPDWQEYLNIYKQQWCRTTQNGLMFVSDNIRYQYEFKEQVLDKKLIRAYMSFLKEIYVLYWFYNRGYFRPYYSFDNDMAGFDITIQNRYNNLFGIKIYSNTYNAKKFASIKSNTRNKLPENSTGIAIQSGFTNDCKLGDTYVFPDKLLNGVYHYINNNIQKDIIL